MNKSDASYDLGVHETFTAEKMQVDLPLVYIASPFAGDRAHNTERAKGYCRFAAGEGVIPIAPHLLYPQFLDDTDRQEREQGLCFALALLERCDELWVFGERVSEGMAREIEKARKRSIPIRRFSAKCQEVQSL